MNEFSKLVLEYDIVARDLAQIGITYKGDTTFRTDRANDLGNGGGTAILCRSSLDLSLVNLNPPNNKGVEFTVMINKIIFNNKKCCWLYLYIDRRILI